MHVRVNVVIFLEELWCYWSRRIVAPSRLPFRDVKIC